MRRVAIVIGALAVAAVAVVAVALHNLSGFVEANREWIASRAAEAIGRPVAFERARVTLWGGAGVRITGVRIADDPSWQPGDLFRADAAQIQVHLLPTLWGRYDVRRIALERPDLTAVRDARGWNVADLGRRGPAPPPGRHGDGDGDGAGESASSLAAAVAVGLVDVHDGRVHLVDRRGTPPDELTVRNVDVRATDVGVRDATHVHVDAALLDDDHNVAVDATVGPLGDAWPVAVDAVPLSVDLEVDDIDVGPLRAAFPRWRIPPAMSDQVSFALRAHAEGTPASLAVRAQATLGGVAADVTGTVHGGSPATAALHVETPSTPLSRVAPLLFDVDAAQAAGTVQARLDVTATVPDGVPGVRGTIALDGVGFGTRGPHDVTATMRARDDLVELGATRVMLGGEALQLTAAVRLVPHGAVLERGHLEGCGGTADATGRFELPPGLPPHLTLDATAGGLGVARLLRALDPGGDVPSLDGRADGVVALTADGSQAPAMRRSLAGTAKGTLGGVVLRGVNLVDRLMQALTGVPGLGDLVPGRLRRQHPELFGGADTRIDQARLTTRIARETVLVDDALIVAPGYTATAKGSVGFRGNVDLRGTFVASEELTRDLIASVREAQFLADDRGRISVPFHVTGVSPDLRVQVDNGVLTRALQRALGGGHDDGKGAGELLRRGLERLLGR